VFEGESGIMKTPSSKSETWKRNHDSIWMAIESFGRPVFTTAQLYSYIESAAENDEKILRISVTRLRKHLNGYISDSKLGTHGRGYAPNCRDFVREHRLIEVRKGRRIWFKLVDFPKRKTILRLRRILNENRGFEEYGDDPSIRPYREGQLLRSYYVNLPKGTETFAGQITDPYGREHQREFVAELIRWIFFRFAQNYEAQLKEETDQHSLRRVGSLEWLLRRRKTKFPREQTD
jgi:hypothetical protein